MLKQFKGLLENIGIGEIEVKQKIKADIEKFTKMQKFFLGTKEKVNISNVDVWSYAKYVLQEGEDVQKRELLSCLRGKILLNNKKSIYYKYIILMRLMNGYPQQKFA